MLALVQGIVDEVNERFATVEQVKTFRMLPKELDHEDGELTATQKVKRSGDRDDVRRPGRVMYGEGGPGASLVRRSSAAWATARSTRCWRSAS